MNHFFNFIFIYLSNFTFELNGLDNTILLQELLPPTATHESVRQQFKQFGNVAYVSLPKYRSSGRIKEFGFVEFEDKASVAKCISAFRQFDGVIGDSQEPENLKSVVAYMKEQDELENEGENRETETNEGETVEKEAGEIDAETEPTRNIEKTEVKKETDPETEAKAETNVEGTEEAKTGDDQQPKSSNKRENEDPLSDSENPPAKRLKTQVSEDQDDQGNTTDERASVTDENQDQKPQK